MKRKMMLGPFRVHSIDGTLIDWLPMAMQNNVFVNRHVHFVNSHVISEVVDSVKLREIFTEPECVCFLDSRPLEILFRKIFKYHFVRQIRGIDFLRAFMNSKLDSTTHFFLGSSDEVLAKLAEICSGNLRIVGLESPPYLDWDDMDKSGICDRIHKSGAEFVWISLGTPKQDFASSEIRKRLGVTTIAIGAALDFLTLEKKEAPLLLRKLGVEWLFRLISEPRRLWKRYLVGNFKAILFLLKEIKR